MASPDNRSKDAATFLAFMGLLVIGASLMLLFMAVLPPSLFWLVMLAGGVFGLGVFHYFVWGRWLTRYLKDRVPDDSEEEREFLNKYGPQD